MPGFRWPPAIRRPPAAATSAHTGERFDKLLKHLKDVQQKFYEVLPSDVEKARQDGTLVPACDMSRLPLSLTGLHPGFRALADDHVGKPTAIKPPARPPGRQRNSTPM